MSNHWDLRCLTCNTDFDLQWNHGGDAIQQLIPHLPGLAQGVPAMEIIDQHDYNAQFPWALEGFAKQHLGHDLAAVDEHGVLHGDCARRYPCECCGHAQACRKPRNHEGDCGPLPEGGAS